MPNENKELTREQLDQEAAELDSVHEKEAQSAEQKQITPTTVLKNSYRQIS